MDKREGSKLQGRQAAAGIQVNAGENRLHRLVACLKCIPETVRWTLRDVCQRSRRCRGQEACAGGRVPGKAGAASSHSGEEEKENREGGKATGETGIETGSSFKASAACRREGNRPALAGSRCTHQNPCRMHRGSMIPVSGNHADGILYIMKSAPHHYRILSGITKRIYRRMNADATVMLCQGSRDVGAAQSFSALRQKRRLC